jgi:hypothetical protein
MFHRGDDGDDFAAAYTQGAERRMKKRITRLEKLLLRTLNATLETPMPRDLCGEIMQTLKQTYYDEKD